MQELNQIFNTIKDIAKEISEVIKYADLGYTTHENATGDTQLKLDVKSDEIITAKFKQLSCVKALISEEKEDELEINKNAKFIIAYDPLDGSSLVDVNFAVGSIFGIYENEVKPENLIAAAYSIYGQFKFVKELELKEKGKLNATGATQKGWSQTHRNFINELFNEGYRLRYSGAMVSDLHQILLKGGGLFSYPATSDHPNGKLRVVFEVLPFAFIYENAKGATTDGKNKTLFDIKIEKIHQTTPCFFGSRDEISLLHKFYEQK